MHDKTRHSTDKIYIVRVRSDSPVTLVAGAIAGKIREDGEVTVRAIGAAAVNQALKALTISQDYLAAEGVTIVFRSSFEDIRIKGEERTALNMYAFVFNS